jgi:molybdopterin synthase catalytic subunit
VKDVHLLTEAFEPAQLIAPFTAAHEGLGGLCTFVGQVRGGEDVDALELTHYEPLTLAGMNDLADQALSRFDLMGILIAHRVGEMRPGEPIVLVAAAARHRRAAIQAVDFAMDHLKSDAWFWKREKSGGQWRWIDPRPEDHEDLTRWAS